MTPLVERVLGDPRLYDRVQKTFGLDRLPHSGGDLPAQPGEPELQPRLRDLPIEILVRRHQPGRLRVPSRFGEIERQVVTAAEVQARLLLWR